jgi:predicted ABC-type ATPase
MSADLEARPILVALAGPNGAGKTTFYRAHLQTSALPYLNADTMARELGVDAYRAAEAVAALREELVRQGESFVFETVLSDPVGDKVGFLRRVAEGGYHVVLVFIGIADVETSEQRVGMRVAKGGHDVPSDKLRARFSRIQANLRRAIADLPHVLVYDNNDLARPFRKVAEFERAQLIDGTGTWPPWLP